MLSMHFHQLVGTRLLAQCLGTLLLLAAMPAAAWAERSALDIAGATITVDSVRKHVGVLSDDSLEGREAGTRGGRAAGLYIVKGLESAGIPGGGPKGSYYQPFGAGYSNILGLLEGRDPVLKQEVIIVSAHYDHVGYGTRRNSFGPIGLIHNGADDNASGVAALLQIVAAFSKLPEPPKRTILFAFWDGEEKGLLGSEHWVAQPTLPLARVKLNINADMVGRLRANKMEIFGSRTTGGLRRVICDENVEPTMAVDFPWEIKSNSDHFTFYKKHIPALLFHTGLHGDYHRPSDDAEKLNHDGLKQIAQLMFLVVDDLAEAPSLAPFRDKSEKETPTAQAEAERSLTLPASRFGMRWDPKSPPGSGVVVVSVEPRSPASETGLRRGDRIVQFGPWSVSSPENFRSIVLAAQNPVTLRVERPGVAEPLEANLILAGKPSRLGITWRTDDAEPGVPILNRVLPGSPADLAGLHANDRIYQIAGRDFDSIDEFRELAATLPGPLELTVETAGQVRRVMLHPADETIDSAPIPVDESPSTE